MNGTESEKPHSSLSWLSHFSPENSEWLAENLLGQLSKFYLDYLSLSPDTTHHFFTCFCLGVMLLPENDSHLTVLLLMGYKSTGYFSRSTNCTFEGQW